jgi:hypothetical protein
VLQDRLETAGVEVRMGSAVNALERLSEGGFSARTADGRDWRCDQVLLCSGGVSLPKLGADSSGMALAEGLGHTRRSLHPGLVALESDDPWVRRAQGVKVSARVQATIAAATVVDTDDLLFAKYGVSGFTILNLSARLVPHLREGGPLKLCVSLLPSLSAEHVSELLKIRWDRHPHRGALLSLAGLVHDKLARALLDKVGIDARLPVVEIGKRRRWDLARVLTAWEIEVTGPRPFDYAEVTIGGICTDEVDPHSLESYLAPGLYLAGEMLDVHGDLGGYNFQWAWSSGHVAGSACAR